MDAKRHCWIRCAEGWIYAHLDLAGRIASAVLFKAHEAEHGHGYLFAEAVWRHSG